MGKFEIDILPAAGKEIKAIQKSGNKSSIKNLQTMTKQLSETPFSGIGKPEPLRHQLSGLWSREINKKDRLIYKVEGSLVSIISAKGHYSDR